MYSNSYLNGNCPGASPCNQCLPTQELSQAKNCPVEASHTAWDWILSQPNFQLYAELVRKADLVHLFRDIYANMTIFVVPDEHLPETKVSSIDLFQARMVMDNMILDKRITYKLLTKSKFARFVTRDRLSFIPVQVTDIDCCDPETHLDVRVGTSRLVDFNIVTSNAIIHILDDIIQPSRLKW